MKKPEIQSSPDQPAIQLKPIISYPRIAEPGEHYLLTIDLQLAENSPWPYPEEEFEISFVLKTEPFFQHEPFAEDEPGLVLHRFGSTYGPAEYLLTASQQPVPPGKITITLLNGWGLPIAHLELECEIKQEIQENNLTIRRSRKEQFASSFTSSSLTQVDQEDTLHSAKEQRDLIAQQLTLVGWNVLSVKDITESSGENVFPGITVPFGNIALRGYLSIEDDYLLIIDRELIGYVKVYTQEKQLPAQRADIYMPDITRNMNVTLMASNDTFATLPVLFLYETTFYETIFSAAFDFRLLRNIYTFHQPATLTTWHAQTSDMLQDDNLPFRSHLLDLPPLEQGSLYDYQFAAMQKIEQSLSNYHSRTLIQIEIGSGQTHIAINSIYRLLTHANAKHILYIVNTSMATQYAFNAFQNFVLPGSEQKFTDIYKVRRISDEKLDTSIHVYIGMLEEFYELYASGFNGDLLPLPIPYDDSTEVWRTAKYYCASLPIEYFDAIYLAECQHINYRMWEPVLDYFDTFYIGITDTIPDSVLHFFNDNLVYSAINFNNKIQEVDLARQQQVVAIIKSVRDLLRKDSGLSGETDRLPQLVWLLFLKYLDDLEETQKELLGDHYIPIIETQFRWRNWVVAESLTHRRKGEELLTFINDDLFPYLQTLSGETKRDIRTIIDTIFRGTYNRIRSGYILREVVDKLNLINFNSSNDIHAISLFYETMLKEMRDSAGDAGEFYTPRPIVSFIIDCLNPQLGESILDPACGTAGFLTEVYTRLESQVRTPKQRQQLQDDLHGIEKKAIPYLLAIMNMLLHGIEIPNLQERNALIPNSQHFQDDDFADVIATNPPFGGEEERGILANFPEGMRTTETAQLFFQYIMEHLKRPTGRCGVILPNGFLFGNGIASVIKKKLLIQFNLHTIVRLPVGTFAPYTSIPTNILFFEATQNMSNSEKNPGTKEIWYYEIPLPEGRRSYSKTKPIRDEDFNACLAWWDHREENEHAWKVSSKEILASDCNLDLENPSILNPRHQFIIHGEIIYELDTRGKKLHEGTITSFAQQALKSLVNTPDDLRKYWSNTRDRKILIEQFANNMVGLDTLAKELKLSDVDHFDILMHFLFQQPMLTREERVQRLRTEHSSFFQRFEHNLLANELLNAILEKYIQGDAPDISDIGLLSVPPLSIHTRMEWIRAFGQGKSKASISTVLKELQQLLYL